MNEQRISIVTPSFNSGRFLKRTINSVLSQGYDDLEYILIDGGSTDESKDVIAENRHRFAHCIVEPDAGQYHAINRGLNLTTGGIMAWLNADDVYLPNTLRLVAKTFQSFPEVEWLTTRFPLSINEDDLLITTTEVPGFSKHGYLRGDNLPAAGWEGTAFIQQESTFWRRSLWDKAGAKLEAHYQFAADFALWGKFFDLAELYAIDVPLACFRKHSAQKTSRAFDQYLSEAKTIFNELGGKVPGSWIQALRIRAATKRFIPGMRFKWQQRLFKQTHRIEFDWGQDRWRIAKY